LPASCAHKVAAVIAWADRRNGARNGEARS
jgi:hypothetical protein